MPIIENEKQDLF